METLKLLACKLAGALLAALVFICASKFMLVGADIKIPAGSAAVTLVGFAMLITGTLGLVTSLKSKDIQQMYRWIVAEAILVAVTYFIFAI